MGDSMTRGALLGAAGVAAVGAAAGVAIWKSGGDRPDLGDRVVAARVPDPVPGDDPRAGAWGRAEAIRVLLAAQTITQPALDALGIGDVTVRALHDGTSLALRLDWEDPDADDVASLARFQDAVAVQIPAASGAKPPSVAMGGPGQAVHILQWRATWQRDIDSGHRTGVADIFPRVVHDTTPDQLLGDAAVVYYPGRHAGNPLAQLGRTSPVEEAVAEGFGTLASLPQQRAAGRGVHEDGWWRVALSIPMQRAPAGAALVPGSSWPVAFALWLGDRGNRGSRKQFADWVTLEVAA
ncbi:MAG: ethylbenzene dehydrogenase-related protein [Actinomycetota bacterium]